MQTQAMAARLSKFKVGELALKSALELERARMGASYDRLQLAELADALRVSAGASDDSGKVAFMRPGYLEPLERVYFSNKSSAPESAEELRHFVEEAISQIDLAASAQDSIDEKSLNRLVDLCLELNREFVRRNLSESRGGRRQRSVPVEAFVR